MGGKGSGGSRPNTGRKGKLDVSQQALVNDVCDDLARAEIRAAENEAIAKRHPRYAAQIELAFAGDKGGDSAKLGTQLKRSAARRGFLGTSLGKGHRNRVKEARKEDRADLLEEPEPPAIPMPAEIFYKGPAVDGRRCNVIIALEEGDDIRSVEDALIAHRPYDWFDFRADEDGEAWLESQKRGFPLNVRLLQRTKLEANVKRLARAELLKEHGINITIDMIGRVWLKRYRTIHPGYNF